MTLQDYLQKHSLTLWREYPDFKPDQSSGFGRVTAPIASVFVTADTGKFSQMDKFQILANGEKTLFVSVNTSAGVFRIVHADMLLFYSPWEPVARDYSLQSPATMI
jgi:hypothetical protein